jgi:RNA polymerase sigma-70 factor, ECF subfamily
MTLARHRATHEPPAAARHGLLRTGVVQTGRARAGQSLSGRAPFSLEGSPMTTLESGREGGAVPDLAAEASLIARLKAGDEAAFAEVVEAQAGRCLAVARRFMRTDDDAQDAVQDAFLSMFRNIDRFDGQSRLSTWLHRIVVNACLMKLRARSRRPETSIESLLPSFVEDGHQSRPSTHWPEDPAAGLEQRELRALVRRRIDELPEPYRNVLLLRDIEGLDTAETAAVLGLSETAVKTRLHRARQALRGLLDQDVRGQGRTEGPGT